MKLPNLFDLFNNKYKVLSMQGILSLVLGDKPEERLTKAFTARFNAQVGRTSGEVLGRAICEGIDAVMESNVIPGLGVEERIKIGKGLAVNVALQLSKMAERVLEYAELAANVTRAKEGLRPGQWNDDPDVQAARALRNQGTARVKNAGVNIGRVVAQNDPRGEEAEEEKQRLTRAQRPTSRTGRPRPKPVPQPEDQNPDGQEPEVEDQEPSEDQEPDQEPANQQPDSEKLADAESDEK